jgi:protein-disulfide isomerase
MMNSHLPTVLIAGLVSAIVSAGATFAILKSGGGNVHPQGDEASAYVRQALLNDPQMLEDAIGALQNLREQDQASQAQAAIDAVKPALFSDPRDASLGVADAKFTLVEFFDYNCGYCKVAANWTREQLEAHPDDIRIIFKDFPVLEGRAPGSQESSLAAMAVWEQGADVFHDFHFAMMEAKGGFDSERIDEIAKAAGVDVDKMRAVMLEKSEGYVAHMNDTMSLAASLRIDGTPAFIADGILVHGANTDELQRLLDEALAKS